MRILLVEDSRTIRAVIKECLKGMWHEIIEIDNGQDALSYCMTNNVDLILMDVEMPIMNGVDTTKAIRAYKKTDWFPIIFLSSNSDDESFVTGILAGGDAYLPKPINHLRLQLTIVAMERIYIMRQELHRTQKELEKVNKDLDRMAHYDQLTKLANRRHFDETLSQQFALAKRNKTPLSMIICDIDFFKVYNDTYGHQEGDNCLAKVAAIIAEQINRPTDLACRYGGEEFTVILPNTPLKSALKIAENMREAVFCAKIPHRGSKIAPNVSLSLGVSTYYGQFNEDHELTKSADEALYTSKGNGRNKVSSGSVV